MSSSTISVHELSKAYRIGLKEQIHDTLTSAVLGWARRPLDNLRRLKRLNTFSASGNGTADDIIWALKDVSFEVGQGEVVGIIGRNGAGKSTLLKLLSRITEPTSGRAVIRGRVSSLLEVGTGFHPELTGRENIYMNGTVLGMTKREIDRKFDEIVEFSGVEKFLDTPTKRYSSGMTVRLAFSVAAHLEPEILIIDEVLAVGDGEFQKKCLGKMQDVARGGRTVLFVSHNMAAVESLCVHAFELRAGRIVAMGVVSEVIKTYREFIHASIGDQHKSQQLFDTTKYISNIEVLDVKGLPTPFVEVGRPVSIRLVFHASNPIRDARIRISFDEMGGRRLLMVQTPARANVVGEIVNSATVTCTIPEFPLAPGRYLLNVSLSENRQVLEDVQGAAVLSVEDAELFGEGRGAGQGLVVARSKWKKE